MSVRPKADPSLQWAYRPDEETRAALARGVAKFKEHPELGSDRPHEAGNMAQALKAERVALDKAKPKIKRRKKMAKKVTLKELAKRSKKRVEVDADEVRAPEKKAKRKGSDLAVLSKAIMGESKKGKLVPLKALCADLELDPKATRVKLRRLIAQGKIDFHDQSQRWEFTQAQVKEIKEYLS